MDLLARVLLTCAQHVCLGHRHRNAEMTWAILRCCGSLCEFEPQVGVNQYGSQNTSSCTPNKQAFGLSDLVCPTRITKLDVWCDRALVSRLSAKPAAYSFPPNHPCFATTRNVRRNTNSARRAYHLPFHLSLQAHRSPDGFTIESQSGGTHRL
jgi:hypothetical protein